MSKTATINWCPFGKKHQQYIRRALQNKMSVAEGSIRSGKTIDHCIIMQALLETAPDKIHLASGSTLANAKMNIGDCNGFGLEHLFRGRCRWGKYRGNECLYVYTKTGEKIVIFAGGGLANSYKKILGNSYGIWIATEVNEHYDCDDSRESFIKVAMGRQMMAKNPRILWDLNPCNPKHSIYSDYIDLYKNPENFAGGYNYEHFTMFDNKSLSREEIEERTRQYDKTSIWYRRDILGQRCVAEGLVYRQFADNPEKYILHKDKERKQYIGEAKNIIDSIFKINVGVDFGGNGSATAFVATGFTRNFEKVVVLQSQRIDDEQNPEELNETFANFITMCYNEYGKPMDVYADSAEQILIRGLKNTAIRQRLHCNVRNARKMPINDRIKLTNKLIAQDRLRVCEDAETVTEALCEALWDVKHPDVRLDNGSNDIDTLDAYEYSIEPFMNELGRL